MTIGHSKRDYINKQWLHCRKWQFSITYMVQKWPSWFIKLVVVNFLFSFFFWCIILLLIIQWGSDLLCNFKQKLLVTQYKWTIKNCLRPMLGHPQWKNKLIKMRDRTTSKFIEEHLGKLTQQSKRPLQGNGMAPISKKLRM